MVRMGWPDAMFEIEVWHFPSWHHGMKLMWKRRMMTIQRNATRGVRWNSVKRELWRQKAKKRITCTFQLWRAVNHEHDRNRDCFMWNIGSCSKMDFFWTTKMPDGRRWKRNLDSLWIGAFRWLPYLGQKKIAMLKFCIPIENPWLKFFNVPLAIAIVVGQCQYCTRHYWIIQER